MIIAVLFAVGWTSDSWAQRDQKGKTEGIPLLEEQPKTTPATPKPATTTKKPKASGPAKSTTTAPTAAPQAIQIHTSSTLVLSQEFIKQEVRNPKYLMTSYSVYEKLMKDLANKPAWTSGVSLEPILALDLDAASSIPLYRRVSVNNETMVKQVAKIDLLHLGLKELVVDYLTNHKTTLLLSSTSEVIQPHQVIVINHDSKSVHFMPSLVSHLMKQHHIPSSTFWKHSYGLFLREGYESYIKEITNLFAKHALPTHDKEVCRKIDEFCKSTPASGEIFVTCALQAEDQTPSEWSLWEWEYQKDIEPTLYSKVTVECYQDVLWNEFMYHQFLGQKYQIKFSKRTPEQEAQEKGFITR